MPSADDGRMIELRREEDRRERAWLVALETGRRKGWRTEDSLDELALLARTAGAEVAGRTVCRRWAPHPATFIGKGKAAEIAASGRENGADLVIFDDDLSPAQLRNLQDLIGLKIVDRTELVLDIFAHRARTSEAKLQIEMAQLQYLLPRLAGKGILLSRLGGGIGTRGPGETKLEVDRRRIRDKIHQLKGELDGVRRQRRVQRGQRLAAGVPVVSIIGYTNSGKTTLFNALTTASAPVEDKLFATLDPATRKAFLPSGRETLFNDTVGFIQKLPHHLVDSFRATLEEVLQADLLLLVMDASGKAFWERKEAVENVLAELGASSAPRLNVLNKIDLVRDEFLVGELTGRLGETVAISAREGIGLEELLERVDRLLSFSLTSYRLLIPQSRPDLIAFLHQKGKIVRIDYHREVVYVEALLTPQAGARFKNYLIDE